MRKPPLSLLLAYVLFGAFMFLECSLRRGQAASTSLAGEEDQGTTRLLGAAYGAGFLLMPLFAAIRGQRRVPNFCRSGDDGHGHCAAVVGCLDTRPLLHPDAANALGSTGADAWG
jgi:hypothetical protein